MLATVRNRRGIVGAVEPFDAGPEGRVHLVTVEYLDADGLPEDQLLWECEPGARLLEPTALPEVARDQPMTHDEFDAVIRAVRWTAMSPFLDPDGDGPLERSMLTAAFHGAVQLDDFQLVPLLKAMAMPRVSLLLADDVGLGKTVEAGLILTELILRRRVRRVLVLCPASLRVQWKQEMRDKFALDFDVVDRSATHSLQRRAGLDANPWRTYSRIITSYDYLKQADVLEQFRAACRVPEGSPHLMWDLLIVDEAHNLAPAPVGEESDLSEMLRLIAPHFEHRLFLTATPHNGYTRSFTGLLEYLDPVRFTRKSDAFTPAERARVQQVVVRRLKREINARTNPPRFAERHLQSVPLRGLSQEEQDLAAAFQAFRARVRSLVADAGRGERTAGTFAVEVLGKRLLSCPVAFATSWHRYREGLDGQDTACLEEVRAAQRLVGAETADDRESEAREHHAARTVGAWLKPFAAHLAAEMAAVDTALLKLGLAPAEALPQGLTPSKDARLEALCEWIDRYLRTSAGWRADERLVVFTEYKTTLDYLERQLRARYPGEGRIRVLFGGMDDTEREAVKVAFNDPTDQVRILVATDAASEGLNLQQTARYVFHFDIPWNPARLEQRNGRLDRHGQARDVSVFHFTSDNDADLAFLAYVAAKADQIREDLGSAGQVFDAAIERRLLAGEAVDRVCRDLDKGIQAVAGRSELPREEEDAALATAALQGVRDLGRAVDLEPETLRETLDTAMGLGLGRPRLEGPDSRGRFRLKPPVPPVWEPLLDDALRVRSGQSRGALPALAFDPALLVQEVGGRPVFRPEPDTAIMHLGHPVIRRAVTDLARARFPGALHSASRWTVRYGSIPAGAEALLLLTVEEMAVNELREIFHHWVRTLAIPVRRGKPDQAATLGQPRAWNDEPPPPEGTGVTPEAVARARVYWDEVAPEVRSFLERQADELTVKLTAALEGEREAAIGRETEGFRSRQGELSALVQQNTVQRLEREIAELEAQAKQTFLFDAEQRLEELLRSVAEKEEEIRRRTEHYQELAEQLRKERERVLGHIIPRRYTLRQKAQVFPIAVEVRLPEGQS